MNWYTRSVGEEIREQAMEILTVSHISSIIESVLDDRRLQDVWVRGEITNLKVHASGHRYFSLGEKIGGKVAVISCVMWRSDGQRLRFEPCDGMDVLVFGSVGHYAPQGRYQFYVRDIRHAGKGEKHLLVEKWKEELRKEGCFEPERKRVLPPYPGTVGVVTSETGAVLQDVRNVITRRYPVELVVSPTAVQGEEAHLEIVRAIQRVQNRVEVIIIARGGGSFEDLFPFNRPEVVRAISSCPVPVVSAIGHEVDVTLSDFAADLRAPTPSAAAEMVVPDRINLLDSLRDSRKKMNTALLSKLDRAGSDLTDMRDRLSPRRMSKLITGRREDLAGLSDRLARALSSIISLERERLRSAREVLEAKNPLSLLDRGYCILEKQGQTVKTVAGISPGDRLRVRLRDGRIGVNVEELSHDTEI